MNNKLSRIIETGKKLNEENNYPNNVDKIKLKLDIIDFCSGFEKTFILSKEFIEWKNKVKDKNIDNKIPEWMLTPLNIFTYNKKEFCESMCNFLFEKKYKYIRSKNDLYPHRFTIEVEFELVAIVQDNNKYLEKHLEIEKIYGANFNINDFILLPFVYYEYITPLFNYELWSKNIEVEKNIWEKINPNSAVLKPKIQSNNNFQEYLRFILTESENSYLFSGLFSYFRLMNEKYNGPITIFHVDPIAFLNRLNEKFKDIEIKEEEPIFYFYDKKYTIFDKEGKVIIELYNLDFGYNFIRIDYENHMNYHGIILSLLLYYLEENKSNEKIYIDLISTIFIEKEKFFKKNKINSCLDKSKFQVFQDKIIGKNNTPFLNFKLKEWNKELDFFYRPDKKDEEETVEKKPLNTIEKNNS